MIRKYFIYKYLNLQYSSKSFIVFIPNYKSVNNNNKYEKNANIIQYENKIIELTRELNYEKNKNKNLINENNNLKTQINKLNNDIIILNKKIVTLENNLSKNNNELQNYNEDNYIITTKNLGDKLLSINFVSIGNQDICNYSLICENSDLFVRLEERLYQDFPQYKEYETFFKIKTKRIKRFKTIEENNIKNNDIITIFRIEDDD